MCGLLSGIVLNTVASVTRIKVFSGTRGVVGVPADLVATFNAIVVPEVAALLTDDSDRGVSCLGEVSIQCFAVLIIKTTFNLTKVDDILTPICFNRRFTSDSMLVTKLKFDLVFIA